MCMHIISQRDNTGPDFKLLGTQRDPLQGRNHRDLWKDHGFPWARCCHRGWRGGGGERAGRVDLRREGAVRCSQSWGGPVSPAPVRGAGEAQGTAAGDPQGEGGGSEYMSASERAREHSDQLPFWHQSLTFECFMEYLTQAAGSSQRSFTNF